MKNIYRMTVSQLLYLLVFLACVLFTSFTAGRVESNAFPDLPRYYNAFAFLFFYIPLLLLFDFGFLRRLTMIEIYTRISRKAHIVYLLATAMISAVSFTLTATVGTLIYDREDEISEQLMMQVPYAIQLLLFLFSLLLFFRVLHLLIDKHLLAFFIIFLLTAADLYLFPYLYGRIADGLLLGPIYTFSSFGHICLYYGILSVLMILAIIFIGRQEKDHLGGIKSET